MRHAAHRRERARAAGARLARRWRNAWRPGGRALKAYGAVLVLFSVVALGAWAAFGTVLRASYYPLGLGLETTAAWVGLVSGAVLLLPIARTDWRLLATLPIFFFVSFAAAGTGLRIVNGAGDRAPEVVNVVAVLERSRTASARYRYLRVASWRPNEAQLDVWVSAELYAANPSRVRLTTRAGWLGYEWLVALEDASSD